MKAITEWEELQGATIWEVRMGRYDETIALMLDDGTCALLGACDDDLRLWTERNLCLDDKITFGFTTREEIEAKKQKELEERNRRLHEELEQEIKMREARDVAEYARLKAKFEGG